jgi:hypothetical protein
LSISSFEQKIFFMPLYNMHFCVTVLLLLARYTSFDAFMSGSEKPLDLSQDCTTLGKYQYYGTYLVSFSFYFIYM